MFPPPDPYGIRAFVQTLMGCMAQIIALSVLILVIVFVPLMCVAITSSN
jgi:hypothetical protein